MQRRDFLAGSALGVAAGVVAAEAARPKDSLVQPAEAGRRVLFHCHTFPPNEKRFPRDAATGLFPGSPEHLAGFCRKLGFTGAMAISPFEVPAGRCTARVEEGTDGPAWLAERAAPLAGRLLLFAGL
ncbi:MAG TPA: twin-arginine translocation signal domain-containing protein, partial [Candidatus Glassbacteria bacterium]|nr:twin-arginine translocation signal domain-containing protein [Candidatus Glassbacteria bacterium]